MKLTSRPDTRWSGGADTDRWSEVDTLPVVVSQARDAFATGTGGPNVAA